MNNLVFRHMPAGLSTNAVPCARQLIDTHRNLLQNPKLEKAIASVTQSTPYREFAAVTADNAGDSMREQHPTRK